MSDNIYFVLDYDGHGLYFMSEPLFTSEEVLKYIATHYLTTEYQVVKKVCLEGVIT